MTDGMVERLVLIQLTYSLYFTCHFHVLNVRHLVLKVLHLHQHPFVLPKTHISQSHVDDILRSDSMNIYCTHNDGS